MVCLFVRLRACLSRFVVLFVCLFVVMCCSVLFCCFVCLIVGLLVCLCACLFPGWLVCRVFVWLFVCSCARLLV